MCSAFTDPLFVRWSEIVLGKSGASAKPLLCMQLHFLPTCWQSKPTIKKQMHFLFSPFFPDFRNTDPETEPKPGPFWVEARGPNPCPCCPFNSRSVSSFRVHPLCCSVAQQAVYSLMVVVCYQLYFKHFLFLCHNNSLVYGQTLKCLLHLPFLYRAKKRYSGFCIYS